MRFLRLLDDEVQGQSTASIVAACCNVVPKGGFTPATMRERLRVLDALEGAEGVLALEDADAKVLADCVRAMTWRVMDARILEFVDLVADLPTAERVGPLPDAPDLPALVAEGLYDDNLDHFGVEAAKANDSALARAVNARARLLREGAAK